MGFNSFIKAWFDRPVLGLPLRMIFTCKWHPIDARIAFAGAAIWFVGISFHLHCLAMLGMILMYIGFGCFALLIALLPIFLLLEKLFPDL